jgi:hypothetical protein
MSESEVNETIAAKTLPRFSYSTILLWILVVYLLINSITLKRDLSQIKQGSSIQAPLSVQEVARQFKERTNLPPMSTDVKDVRYSPKHDSFQVEFSWTNRDTEDTWYTDVKLSGDGYGRYIGTIRNGTFIEPIGHEDGYSVVIESPSQFRK